MNEQGLNEKGSNDPYAQFQDWYADAQAKQVSEFDAMTLATATPSALPSARIVLFKGFRNGNFKFFTNYESRKGQELLTNPHAALVFHWAPLGRQVRVEGTVASLPAVESDRYWQGRARLSQLGAHASRQSQDLASYEELEKRVADLEREYAGKEIPRPAHWGGFEVIPTRIEFWSAHPNRLNRRMLFVREAGSTVWRSTPLNP